MNTRIILPTPCHNPTGHGRTTCQGQVTWEDHGKRRLGTCNTCGHEYVAKTPVYEQTTVIVVQEPAGA